MIHYGRSTAEADALVAEIRAGAGRQSRGQRFQPTAPAWGRPVLHRPNRLLADGFNPRPPAWARRSTLPCFSSVDIVSIHAPLLQ